MASKRSVADWIWTIVGVAGVACIGVAIWMFLGGGGKKDSADVAKEQAEKADACWKAGREKLAAGDAAGAVKEIQAAAALVDPRHPAMAFLHNDLGKALLQSGRADEATKHFVTSFSMNPTFFEPYLMMGKILEDQGQLVAAWQFRRAGLALHPDPVPEELKETVANLASSTGKARAEEIAKFEGELAANPANLDALTVLLVAHLQDASVAEDAAPGEGLRAAVASTGAAITGLGELLKAQEGAVEARPGSVVDRAGLGCLLLLAGETPRARQVYGEAVGLSESDASARFGMALCDLLSGAEGEASAEEAAKRLGGSPVAWLALGASLLSHGKAEPAQAALSNALRLNPATPEVYRLLAMALTGEKNAPSREASLRAYRRLAARRA